MSAKPQITKPSRLIAAAKAGEDNLVAEYLTENKKLDVNKVNPFFLSLVLISHCSATVLGRLLSTGLHTPDIPLLAACC